MAYPRKLSYGQLEKNWKSSRKQLPPIERLLEILETHIEYWKAEKRPIDKIPYPATWISGKSWNDEIHVPTPLPESLKPFPHMPGYKIYTNKAIGEFLLDEATYYSVTQPGMEQVDRITWLKEYAVKNPGLVRVKENIDATATACPEY
jgi:hypothetical protein